MLENEQDTLVSGELGSEHLVLRFLQSLADIGTEGVGTT